MNPTTLPTSPETRAALEQAGWQVHPINAGYVVLMKGKSSIGLWADGNHVIHATAPQWSEVAAILGITIPGYRIIPEETAAVYLAARTAFYGHKVDGDPDATRWTRYEDAEEALAVALGGARPLPPHPSEDGGPSPSEMAEPTDEQLRMHSEIISREPGFHQVNPINQRKAPAPPADPLALLEVLYNSAVNDSRLDRDVERRIRQALGLDNVAEPNVVGHPPERVPPSCPITDLPFFCMEYLDGKRVPTYGGPFDTYTIPTPDEESDSGYAWQRYDQDSGGWAEGWENVPQSLVKSAGAPTTKGE